MKTDHDTIAQWYRDNRLQMTGLGAWLDGGEPGRMDSAAFDSAGLRILFCRLSPYRDVRPSISHRMLYWAASTVRDVYPDLAWLPPLRDAALMSAAGIPWWTASGAKQSPTAFDILAISISTPQEALNLPAALKRSGLALSHAERLADKSQPLIVLGGQAAGSVPFIHGHAGPGHTAAAGGLVDIVCLGDGLEWLRELLALGLRAGRGRLQTILPELARVPGSYIPSLYAHHYDDDGSLTISPADPDTPLPALHRTDDSAAWTTGYDGAYIPFDDDDQEETLPLAFGCRYRCRFCQTGWIRKNLSSTGAEALIACAGRIKQAMAASDLNLLASDACSVAGLDRIVGQLTPAFRHVSVKSLALASMARHAEADAVVRMLDKREFTFGVEGVSRRLRRWLGKQADAVLLFDAMKRLARSGIRQLKLFFILTGLEEEKDVEELRALLDSVRAIKDCRAIASFTPLFHAPFTPMGFAPMYEPGDPLVTSIRQTVTAAGAEFRLSADPAEIRLINLLCRAGRRATSTLLHLSLDRGFRYYETIPTEALAVAEQHLAGQGIDIESLTRECVDSVLPWDDIQAGHTRRQLLKSYRQALEEEAGEGPSTVASYTTTRPHPPATRQAPVEEATLSFRIMLDPADALRPGATVARGALRRMFVKSPNLLAGYRGLPQLIRFPLASGLAILRASFRADIRPEADLIVQPPPPDAPWFLVRFAGDPARTKYWLDRLRQTRIPFQSVRRDGNLWHVINPTHRSKTGLASVIECDRSFRLLATSALAALPGDECPRFLAHGVTEILGEMETGKCKTCGSRRFRPIHGESALPLTPSSLCAH
jgi:radical SAM superfamily enzyme YgiQ (UPF0313 family)